MTNPGRTRSAAKWITSLAAMTLVLAACSQPAAPAAPAATQAPEQPAATAAPAATEVPAATEAPQATTAPEATVEATKAAEQPAAGEMKKYKGEIVVSVRQSGSAAAQAGFKALIEAYNKLQPDVKIIVEGPPEGTEYGTWLGTQLAAGNVRPDIVSGNDAPTYSKFANLDKFRFQTNPYTGNEWDKDFDWNFYVERNAKGERRMIATEAVHILWFYNKDLFDKAGVAVPTTWDEMAEACDKLKAAGITPIASNFQWKVPQWLFEIYIDQYNRDWVEIARAQPGDFNYDEDIDGQFKFDPKDPFIETKYNFNIARFWAAFRDGKISFDTPEMTELVTNMSKVFPRCASSSLFVDTTDYSEFLQQEVAMIVDGTWSLPGLARDMKSLSELTEERKKELKIGADAKLQPFEWGTFENPPIISGLAKFPVRSVESAAGIYASIIDKNAEQTDMVKDFLMFWYSQPGHQAYIDGRVNSPDGYSPGGPIMVRGVTLPAEMEAIMKNIRMTGNAENSFNWLPVFGGGPDALSKQTLDYYKQALEGKIKPAEFGQKVQKLLTDNLDEILKYSGLTRENLDHPERQPGS